MNDRASSDPADWRDNSFKNSSQYLQMPWWIGAESANPKEQRSTHTLRRLEIRRCCVGSEKHATKEGRGGMQCAGCHDFGL